MRNAPPAGFGITLTPLAKRVLVALIGMFVVQLVLESWLHLPLSSTLAWHGLETGRWRIWQVLTCYLLNGPGPMEAFFDWLFIVFFFSPVQQTIGRRGLIRVAGLAIGISAVVGCVLNWTGAVTAVRPFYGLNPLLTPLIVIFGLSRPNAQILLFFVLPIKASWIAWGTGLMALLTFLSSRDLGSTLWLTGWIAGYVYMDQRGTGALRKMWLQHKQREIQKRLQKFKVIEGGGEGGTSSEEKPRPLWGGQDDDGTVH